MDEPLFKQFGSEKMIGLIKLLGMKESEAIEHPLQVSKSIAKAQDKIATQVLIETISRFTTGVAGQKPKWDLSVLNNDQKAHCIFLPKSKAWERFCRFYKNIV
jgi:hypothetical protein